jgi:hypothetical protein
MIIKQNPNKLAEAERICCDVLFDIDVILFDKYKPFYCNLKITLTQLSTHHAELFAKQVGMLSGG